MAAQLVAALYHFAPLADIATLQVRLLELCRRERVKGTLLLAHEGINGTIAGPEDGIRRVLAHLRALPGLEALEHKESRAATAPFHRLKVRCKREIVTMGVADIDPVHRVGRYVDAQDWNALIREPDVVLVDVRNDYEVAIGSFDSAIDPGTATFSTFPDWVREQSAPGGVLAGRPRVAMFCTGGIRCEKSTAYLRALGFDDVYHLRGGILKYLETVAPQDSLWHGECFVFDERVAVGHGLQQGSHELCHACGWPIDADDKASAQYEPGISCPHCHDRLDAQRRARLAARHQARQARA
ncbi:MAG: rhodanese-related sulfurtransferase [Castellaniella sp.]